MIEIYVTFHISNDFISCLKNEVINIPEAKINTYRESKNIANIDIIFSRSNKILSCRKIKKCRSRKIWRVHQYHYMK